MIKPEDEAIPDLSTSCTKDVAVAKMLGWMRGPIHPKYIRVTEAGIPEDQMEGLMQLEDSLDEQLAELREAARQELLKAAEEHSSIDILKEKENKVRQLDEMIKKAAVYMRAINHELTKSKASKLIIDKAKTDETGETYIDIISLNKWSFDKYKIKIIDDDISDAHHEMDDLPNAAWEDVTIKILANYRISFSLKKGKFSIKSFREIGLMHKSYDKPNNHGLILIGLSEGMKFPGSSTLEKKHKTAISKLRDCLRNLTGMQTDPFQVYNKHDGYKPRFKLIDDRSNADRRAEEAAYHETYIDEDHPDSKTIDNDDGY